MSTPSSPEMAPKRQLSDNYEPKLKRKKAKPAQAPEKKRAQEIHTPEFILPTSLSLTPRPEIPNDLLRILQIKPPDHVHIVSRSSPSRISGMVDMDPHKTLKSLKRVFRVTMPGSSHVRTCCLVRDNSFFPIPTYANILEHDRESDKAFVKMWVPVKRGDTVWLVVCGLEGLSLDYKAWLDFQYTYRHCQIVVMIQDTFTASYPNTQYEEIHLHKEEPWVVDSQENIIYLPFLLNDLRNAWHGQTSSEQSKYFIRLSARMAGLRLEVQEIDIDAIKANGNRQEQHEEVLRGTLGCRFCEVNFPNKTEGEFGYVDHIGTRHEKFAQNTEDRCPVPGCHYTTESLPTSIEHIVSHISSATRFPIDWYTERSYGLSVLPSRHEATYKYKCKSKDCPRPWHKDLGSMSLHVRFWHPGLYDKILQNTKTLSVYGRQLGPVLRMTNKETLGWLEEVEKAKDVTEKLLAARWRFCDLTGISPDDPNYEKAVQDKDSSFISQLYEDGEFSIEDMEDIE